MVVNMRARVSPLERGSLDSVEYDDRRTRPRDLGTLAYGLWQIPKWRPRGSPSIRYNGKRHHGECA